MIAVLGGLGAASFWATSLLCSSRSTKLIGAASALAWVMFVGFVLTVPLAAAGGVQAGLNGDALAWLAIAGVGNTIGLLLQYTALRIGLVSIVAPIVSTGGSIAAVIAVVAGESIGVGAGAMLALIAGGIMLATAAPVPADDASGALPAALLAAAAAACFGAGLYATARISDTLPLVWSILPARVVGAPVVGLLLLIKGRLRLTRSALPLVLTSGSCEVVGFASYGIGARHGIAVTAVVGSQFAAFAVLFAYLVFRERLTKLQLAGIVAIAAGASALSGLQA